MDTDKEVRAIPLKDIVVDGGTQSRAALDEDVVVEYAEVLANGGGLPDSVVFYDGSKYYLADGFHRHEAHQRQSIQTLNCEVRQGTRRAAVLYSVGANAEHGLRRSSADKRRAVEMLLGDKEWAAWANRAIAKACAVSERLVRTLRQDATPPATRSYLTRHGTEAAMDTSSIGTKSAPDIEPEDPFTETEDTQPDPPAPAGGAVIPEPTETDEQEPFATFAGKIREVVSSLRSIRKGLEPTLGYDAATKQIREKWAQEYSVSGTLVAVDGIIRNLEQGIPIRLDDSPRGYATAGSISIKKRNAA